MNDQHFLNNIFKAQDFSVEERDIIFPKFKQVSFSKNDFLLQEGTTENYYWFVESGFVRSYVVDTEGNDISTNFYSTGDIVIDWTSFFSAKPYKGKYSGFNGLCLLAIRF
ncbi:Crp/Fnr family transcriptional regulator [Zobellia nedashkovskayae]